MCCSCVIPQPHPSLYQSYPHKRSDTCCYPSRRSCYIWLSDVPHRLNYSEIAYIAIATMFVITVPHNILRVLVTIAWKLAYLTLIHATQRLCGNGLIRFLQSREPLRVSTTKLNRPRRNQYLSSPKAQSLLI